MDPTLWIVLNQLLGHSINIKDTEKLKYLTASSIVNSIINVFFIFRISITENKNK